VVRWLLVCVRGNSIISYHLRSIYIVPTVLDTGPNYPLRQRFPSLGGLSLAFPLTTRGAFSFTRRVGVTVC
jgi:hypothetical protein